MEATNEEFQIKHLVKQDVVLFQQLIEVFEDVFEMKKQEKAKASYLKTMLGKPEFISYVIIHNGIVVGGLTAHELQMYYSEHSEMFIYGIAIKSEYQRKGLGKKLMEVLEKYCRQNDIKIMFVEANEEDTKAVDFYRQTGARAEKVVHFIYELITDDVVATADAAL